jgi:hypothetical protein
VNWITGGKYHVTSDCDRFRISKTYHQTVPSYALWQNVRERWQFVARYANAEAAQEHAEAITVIAEEPA